MSTHENKEIIEELREEFEKAKKEIGFKSSFKEIDDVFFVADHVLSEGYVSADFSRQMCGTIRDVLNVWANYLHSLLMPNPQYLMNIMEARLFDEGERKEMQVLIKKALALNSLNALAGLTGDKKLERDFIDGAVSFWNESYKQGLAKIMKKVNNGWSE